MVELNSILGNLVSDESELGVSHGDSLKVKLSRSSESTRFEGISWEEIVPEKGNYLGLDFSKNSSGVTFISNGVRKLYNLKLDKFPNTTFEEVLRRRNLKEKLLELFDGQSFDAIIVEDAYEGKDPVTTRMLYSINTSIDELILDGYISCKEFVRANNSSWKSWLWGIEPNVGKHLNDKRRTEAVLNHLGITDSGKGFQDRLDSTGMVVGYLWAKSTGTLNVKVDRVLLRDLDMYYVRQEDLTALEDYALNNGKSFRIYNLNHSYLTKDTIKSVLSSKEYNESLVVFCSKDDLVRFKITEGSKIGGEGNLLAVELK